MKSCPRCRASCQDWVAACPSCRALFPLAPHGIAASRPVAQGARSATSLGNSKMRSIGGATTRSDAPTDPVAVLALFAALLCGGWFGIPLGVLSLKRIDASNGKLGGRGIASASIGLGILIMILTVVAGVAAALFAEPGAP